MLGLGVTGDAVVRHRAAAGDDVKAVEELLTALEGHLGLAAPAAVGAH